MKTGNNGIKYYNGIELTKLELPKPIELVKELIRQPSLNILFGESGCGKSLLSMNLMFAIAAGLDNFLNYQVLKSGKVLFLNNEIPLSEFIERFNSMKEIINEDDYANIIVPDHVPPIEEYESELSKKIGELDISLVILDCLYWSHNRNENDNSEIKTLMRKLVKIRDEHSVSLLIIHHVKKGSKNNPMNSDNIRGAGVMVNAADSVFELRRSAKDPSLRLFKPTKLRYSSDYEQGARSLLLHPSNLWFDDVGPANEEDHIILNPNNASSKRKLNILDILKPGDVLTRAEIVDEFKDYGYSDRSIDRYLHKAVENGFLNSDGNGNYYL